MSGNFLQIYIAFRARFLDAVKINFCTQILQYQLLLNAYN